MQPKNKSVDQDSDAEYTFIEKARRAQIIAATIEALAEFGYTNTSFAQIAKKSGISRGLISYHFKNKDDLMLQVVMDIYAANMLYVNEQIAAETSARGKLRTYIEANLAHMGKRPKRFAAMIEVVMNARDSTGQRLYEAISHADDDELGYAQLEEIFRTGQEHGEFRVFEARLMAIALRGAIDKVLGQFSTHPTLDLEHYTQQLVELFDQATQKR
jgi:AcrR family transcriptional regulator